jgi:hypothetical protein
MSRVRASRSFFFPFVFEEYFETLIEYRNSEGRVIDYL